MQQSTDIRKFANGVQPAKSHYGDEKIFDRIRDRGSLPPEDRSQLDDKRPAPPISMRVPGPKAEPDITPSQPFSLSNFGADLRGENDPGVRPDKAS